MGASRQHTNTLDRQKQRLHLRTVTNSGKLFWLFLAISLVSLSAVYSWPVLRSSEDENQILRFRFQDGPTSIQVYGMIYAPTLGFPGGAGMLVSIVHQGKHTTGGYHYTWDDVEVSDYQLKMGPQSIEMSKNRFRIRFHSRDLTLDVQAPRNSETAGRNILILRDGDSILTVDGTESLSESRIAMNIYGQRSDLQGRILVDHWKLPRNLPDDLGSIQVTTSLEGKPIFLAQPRFGSSTETYIQAMDLSRPVHFRDKDTGLAAVWPYSSGCKLSLKLGSPIHILDRKSIPSTSRLMGIYLGKSPRIISYESTLIDACGASRAILASETTVLTLH